ncbi:Uncharacterised protein [Mycobacterium tuberculosis]|nr:Uncharacterised protein [Mycobacterium tuberculosis]
MRLRHEIFERSRHGAYPIRRRLMGAGAARLHIQADVEHAH